MEQQWRRYYLIGGICGGLSLALITIDIIAGILTGGNLTQLPQTAVERFAQLRQSPVLGLYNLDLLNTINQIFALPAYFALCAIHRKYNTPGAIFAFILFLTGTIIFVMGNKALPMLDLSHKYFAATTDAQRTLFAAAGESLLVQGAHGSGGVFIGFLLPNIAGILISYLMLQGKLFGKLTPYLGLLGSISLCLYVVAVTYIPAMKSVATMIAMPGGLMLMVWLILSTRKLIKIGLSGDELT